jgi:hypothetical protein
VATVAVPIVLAVNSRAREAEGNRNISIDVASVRAIAQHGYKSGPTKTPDLAEEVPGWRRFAPTARPFSSDTSGESGTARMQSTPPPALQGTQHKEEAARQSSHSPPLRFLAKPRQSDKQRLNEQAESTNSLTDATDARDRIAKHREVVLREFLRWREQLLLSDEKSPQAAEHVVDEFLRSPGKH